MPNYENSLGHWVKRFYLLSTQEMESALSAYELGRTQWYILYHVEEAGTLPQRELQSILNIKSATLTPLVGALVNKGWLAQNSSPTDQRSKILRLTVKGVKHFNAIPNPIIQARKKALAGLDKNEIENARKVLEQAVRNMEA